MMAKRHSKLCLTAKQRLILLLFPSVFAFQIASAQIWSENFNSYADGTSQGPPKWTTNATDCDDATPNQGPGASQWGVYAGIFTINDVEGAPCCPNPPAGFGGGGNDNSWLSESINIANYCNVTISMDVSGGGVFECDSGTPIFGCQIATPPDNSHDQILAEYSINSGPWTQFGYVCGLPTGPLTASGLNGNTLQIRFFAANKSNSEFYYIDNIVVNGTTAPTPTFTPVGPLCENDAPAVLPTNSNNGISGTWNPSSINPAGQGGNTITATFTPTVGQCALPTTMNVPITAATNPSPNPIGPFCSNDPVFNLPTNVSGINGSWSGTGVSGNAFNPAAAGAGSFTLTFTPNAGQCANTTSLPVTVNQANTPVLGTATLCETDPLYSLSNLLDPNFPTGTWSGPGVSGNNFNPSGQNGLVNLTFTPNTTCALPANTSITVNQPVTPPISGVPASICQSDPAISLPTPQGGFAGNWSGQGVSGNMFNPIGLSGNVTLTFTPNAGQCANPATTSINVIVPTTPAIAGVPASICQSDPAISLPTPQGGFAGNWSGQGVSGNMFDPTGLSGNVILTFTPNSGQCASPATTSINVTVPTTPAIAGVPATICQSDPAISLPTPQGGFTGNWSGQGVSGNMFNPTGLSGSVTLTFTPNSGQCANPATTNINVTVPTTPAIAGVPASICQSDPAISLPTPQGGFAGNWSGQGVSGNIFNPTGLSGNVTLTFTPNAGQCANPATTSINVIVPTTPAIAGVPASTCQSDPAISLPTPQGGFAGNWSGQGVSGNMFNPTGLSGNVTLTFTPNAGQCANPATTNINVIVPTTPAIAGVPASICENEPPINLPTTQSGVNGNWSGQGVSGNSFDPNGLSGNVTLTFTPNAGQCANPATASILVNTPVSPTLGTATLCQNDPPLPLSGLVDPLYSNGTWSGPGVSGSNFNPSGLSGNINLTFTPSANCTLPATTVVTVTIAPNFTDLQELCDLNTQTYTVSFTITDGTPPYTVDGVVQPGSTFVSTPIASGTGYTFVLDDANGCGPVLVSGIQNCNCATDAGSMNFDNAPLLLCFNHAQFSVPFNQDEILDNNDVLQFVVHDSPGTTIGTIYAISNAPVINIPPGLVLGQVYYVSPIAGNDDGTGSVDLNDPCLSVSQGIPIIFYLPEVQLGPDASICANECYNVPLQFTGIAPFYMEWNIFYNNIPVGSGSNSGLSSGSTIVFCPADYGLTSGVVRLEVTAIEDANSCGVSTQLPSVNFTINPVPTSNLSPTLCAGESIVVNGKTYNEATPSGTETFFGGSSLGCDSTVNVNLTFFPAAVLNLSQSICPGESITVNGTTYNASNTTGTETLPNASWHGCDSTVNVNLTPLQSPTTNLNQTLCTGGSVTVNGTVYNESNPSGTEVISGGAANGCDSTIVVDLSFNSVVNSNLNPTLCPGGIVSVNGTVYNQANPSGMETFANGSYLGCDSVVNVNLVFYPPAVGNFTQTLCTGGSITIGGTLFNESNPSGTIVLPGASVNGCDSTLNVSLSFNSVVTSNINSTLCAGQSITVNGTVYNQANPSGTETMPGASYLGCDSVALVSLSFFPPANGVLSQTLCAGQSLTVGGVVFNQANPSGTATLLGASVNGCDSIVLVSLGFYPLANSSISQTLCLGGSLTVGSTVFNQANPSGTVTLPGSSSNGCDSTVQVSLSFYPPASHTISQQFCTGGSINVNGTVYNESNPTGTEVLMGAGANGCDSTVYINLSFGNSVIVSQNPSLCPGEVLVVNGTTYSATNPTGSETFPGGSYLGCDSTVNISLSFYPPSSHTIAQQLCFGGSVTVNGTIYNETNPTGTEVLIGASANGCDSTVYINLSFGNGVTENLNPTLCPGEVVVVNGTTYSASNPTGSETFPNGSYLGCDSTVSINLSYFPPAMGTLTQTLCESQSLTIGGTVFNQINPSGTVTLPNASQNGCDSTVQVSLSFYPPISSTITQQLCTGGSITVNGTVYNASNPSGSEVLIGAGANGCDSTIYIDLTFGNAVVVNWDTTVCQGEIVVVNGTVFSASNPTGSVTFPNGSILGCDSTVNVSLGFFPPANGNVTEILQVGDSIVVNGTVYNQQNPTGIEVFQGASYTGCDSTVIVSLTFEMADLQGIVEVTSPSCRFGNNGSITLTSIEGGTPPYVVALNGANSTPVTSFPIIFDNLTVGFYTLNIVDAAGNVSAQEIFMPDGPELVLDMGASLTVPLGNSVTLSANSNSQILTWAWSPPDYLTCTDCPHPVSTPTDDIVYTLAVTDINGCTAEGELSLVVEKIFEVYIPNAFSPNNDGINDEFTVFAGPQVDKVKSLLVFTRWGELIFEFYNFEPNNLQLGWDGTFKGDLLDPAVFVWYAEIEFKDGSTHLFKGDVTLVR